LVDDKTIVWSPTKKKLYNKKLVKEEYGIESKNLLLYRVLDGDTTDNIPGIYGCGIKTLVKRFPELTEDTKLSVDDLFKICEDRILETKGKIKIYKDILDSKKQILLNQELMQLENVDISGQIKMQVLDRFSQPVHSLNKMDFMKILLKYKVINNFGDVNDWCKTTFGNLITD
jgi:DNA polymerase-1